MGMWPDPLDRSDTNIARWRMCFRCCWLTRRCNQFSSGKSVVRQQRISRSMAKQRRAPFRVISRHTVSDEGVEATLSAALKNSAIQMSWTSTLCLPLLATWAECSRPSRILCTQQRWPMRPWDQVVSARPTWQKPSAPWSDREFRPRSLARADIVRLEQQLAP